MGQQGWVVYHRDSHWVNRGGECTIEISSGPVEDKSVH